VYTEFARFVNDHQVFRKIYSCGYLIYKYIAKTPISGAQTSLHLCYVEDSEFINGGYYNNCKLAEISPLAKDKEVRDGLIRLSFNLIKNHKDLKHLCQKNNRY